MPEIVIHAVAGRPAEQKRALMKAITAAVVEHFNVKPEVVVVQIVESPSDSKSRGGIPYAEL